MSARRRRRAGPPPTQAAAVHADWLSLTTPTLPFLSVPVLSVVFPNGPAHVSAGLRTEVVNRWEGTELEDGAVDSVDRREWVRWILTDLLDHGDRVVAGDRFSAVGPEAGTSVSATFAVLDDPDSADTSPARLLVIVLPAGTSPDGRAGDAWSATWTQRMALLCRTMRCRIGLVTDGDTLRFIWAPEKSSTGHATWQASLFSAERAHLDALWTMFHARQFFAARVEEQPEALLERSEAAEAEVTDTLGRQVRRAVELLVASLDRAHRDPGTPPVLTGVGPTTVYDGAVTVLMRLVFLLAAEENELLPVTNRLYSSEYAVTTLRGDLEDAARMGRERLEQRSSAWHRILATTRAVHGGVSHELLQIKPYGGRLFDPDRYPFLEGRTPTDDVPWWNDPGRPPLVDDLTMLEIMRALQVLQLSSTDTRTLSYRNIEVEQIGHVYEGLLDHNATTKDTPHVGLIGRPGDEPEVALADLEAKQLRGRDALIKHIRTLTGKTPKAIADLLDADPSPQRFLALRTVCTGERTLADRVAPFLGVLRDDLRGFPMVFPSGAFYVTQTGSRRETGTAYTTRSLAEDIVEHTLAPLCYSPGPQDTPDRGQWRIRTSEEILNLKVCDPAVGSGAILVAACRYLADALIEAWIAEGHLDPADLASASDNPARNENRVRATRLVAERCCYGVDRNPMAVEMAKMSFWLTTMAQDRPFTHLDHNIQSGDSLLGITNLDQLRTLHLDPAFGRARAIGFPGIDPAGAWTAIAPLLDEAIKLRLEIETSPSDTARDTARKALLSERATKSVEAASAIADQLIGCALSHAGQRESAAALEDAIRANAKPIADLLAGLDTSAELGAIDTLRESAHRLLDHGKPAGAPTRRPLHWPIAFPEVFAGERFGFDACVGNPPFVGGQKITSTSGTDYRRYLVSWIANGARGSADLIAYFFLFATRIASGFGLLATNSVAQGDSSEVGLARIIDAGWTIHRAISSTKWPGSESLEISKVWATRQPWEPSPILDDRSVRAIDEMLYQTPRSGWRKKRLVENADQSFQGSNILGDGFKMSPDEAQILIDKDSRNAEVLFPLLGGEDLNESPTHTGAKWVINFFDWPEERAKTYPDCYAIVEETVKLERERITYSAHAKTHWWRYERERVDLYRRITAMGRVLAVCQTSKVQLPAFVSGPMVFNHKLVVFSYDDDFHFGLLSSMVHWRWVLRFGSTLETRPVYTPSDVFETFPQPAFSEAVASAGKVLDEFRSDLMVRTGMSLTDTYNRFHDPTDKGDEIERLRDLHMDLDYAVRDAYGWDKLLPSLEHGFYQVRLQGDRYTFAPEVADEVIDLLLEENKRRYEAEVARGLHRGPRRRSRPSGDTLFDVEPDEDLDVDFDDSEEI